MSDVGALPGEQYTPSNGTEGTLFFAAWCEQCARDRSMREGESVDECDDDELCPIIARAYLGKAVEWRRLPNADTICTAFRHMEDEPEKPRCTATVDMFGGSHADR